MPLIPVESMVYKSLLCYKRPLYQQYWIDEMKLNMPLFSSKIDNLMLKGRNSSNDIVQPSGENHSNI